MQKSLEKILKAKEQRQSIKQQNAKLGYASISLNLNIPGYPKSNDQLKKVFFFLKEELYNYLIIIKIDVKKDRIKIQSDDAGDICFFPFEQKKTPLFALKKQLEDFEEHHQLGRILDIDLFDINNQAISSGKKKKCLLCEDKALICMHKKKHSYKELREYIEKQTKKYCKSLAKKEICQSLSALATWSVLTEISLFNKPGLVCPDQQGAHTDMNYHTFLASTAGITPYFYSFAKLGYQWDGQDFEQTILKIRLVGVETEKKMFETTKGVNTQKGAIFLLGFSLFAVAYCLKTNHFFDKIIFREILKKLNKDLVNNELVENANYSNGEKCFNKFGKQLAGGIRLEIELGLPTVFEIAYPFMLKLFPEKIDTTNQVEFQDKMRIVLLKIISKNNDTNILHRSDEKMLMQLKKMANDALENCKKTNSKDSYENLIKFCKNNKLSPGGSADLLVMTLFIYCVNNKYGKIK